MYVSKYLITWSCIVTVVSEKNILKLVFDFTQLEQLSQQLNNYWYVIPCPKGHACYVRSTNIISDMLEILKVQNERTNDEVHCSIGLTHIYQLYKIGHIKCFFNNIWCLLIWKSRSYNFPHLVCFIEGTFRQVVLLSTSAYVILQSDW